MSDNDDQDDQYEAQIDGFPTDSGGVPKVSRDQLEVLASHFSEKVRAGLSPNIEDYIHAYPQYADEIKELFPMVAALEQWKSDREAQSLRSGVPEAFDIEQLGDCKIVREIGRGGMGVVFDAVQGTLERRVAVKLLPWRYSMVPRWQERFEKEARMIAKLKHFNIVPIYSFGTHEGYAYYVMQYVEGVSLARIIQGLERQETVIFSDEIAGANLENKTAMALSPVVGANRKGLRRNGWRSLARIGLQVAQALTHAHDEGVLHNDVKPANLLVDATGRIWVTDFGLAGDIAPAEADEGHITGTLRYMAPERFEGVSHETSDVYSLGITMYELITRRPAFESDTRGELVQQIGEGKLIPMPDINKEIPKDLVAVIEKATNPDSSERYQKIAEFGADLQNIVNGKRVSAKRVTGLRKWFRRK
jgi:eukaryotic-like serine/threonine-protein kinase